MARTTAQRGGSAFVCELAALAVEDMSDATTRVRRRTAAASTSITSWS